jgi:hypothetical protein
MSSFNHGITSKFDDFHQVVVTHGYQTLCGIKTKECFDSTSLESYQIQGMLFCIELHKEEL